MAWSGQERRVNLELRRKVAEVSMRLGVSQRDAYKMIKERAQKEQNAQ